MCVSTALLPTLLGLGTLTRLDLYLSCSANSSVSGSPGFGEPNVPADSRQPAAPIDESIDKWFYSAPSPPVVVPRACL
jgi:hypothetical protein